MRTRTKIIPPCSATQSPSPTAGLPPISTMASMESLPEEVLQFILSMVPMDSTEGIPGLLSLRLVCKRWAAAVLGAPVWRHRRLSLQVGGTYHTPGLAVLRLPLTLAGLRVFLSAPSPRCCRRVLAALASTPCTLSALELDVTLTRQSVVAVTKALARQQGSLRELDLTLAVNNGRAKGDPASILAAIDRLTGLTSLTLNYCSLMHREGDYGYTLDGPGALASSSSLQRLGLVHGLSARLCRGLLEASKASLLSVDAGFHADEVLPLLGQCPLLRAVTLHCVPSAPQLALLETLAGLTTLEIFSDADVDLAEMSDFLERRPHLPWRLRLVCRPRGGHVFSAYNASPALWARVVKKL